MRTALVCSSISLLFAASLKALPGYEPFADATGSGGTTYVAGNNLGFDATLTGGQTNAQGFFWAQVNTSSGGAAVLLASGNLSFSSVAGYSGALNLPSSSGISAAFANIHSLCFRCWAD